MVLPPLSQILHFLFLTIVFFSNQADFFSHNLHPPYHSGHHSQVTKIPQSHIQRWQFGLTTLGTHKNYSRWPSNYPYKWAQAQMQVIASKFIWVQVCVPYIWVRLDHKIVIRFESLGTSTQCRGSYMHKLFKSHHKTFPHTRHN